MEIKVGEYVRTKGGYIAKLKEIKEDYYFFDNTVDTNFEEPMSYLEDDELDLYVSKHSFEPIDLIEVDDYVNGKKVIKTNCSLKFINDDAEFGEDEINNGLDLGCKYIYFSDEIKSIVTREQFENMSYKVGD